MRKGEVILGHNDKASEEKIPHHQAQRKDDLDRG
jgi:hypothetical protein